MPDHAPANPPDDWERCRALREQWTHEDNLVNHGLMRLILSQGLLFTAYGTLSTAKLHRLVLGFPVFGMAVSAVIGISTFAALAARRGSQQAVRGVRARVAVQPFAGPRHRQPRQAGRAGAAVRVRGALAAGAGGGLPHVAPFAAAAA